MSELSKAYDPTDVEHQWYACWVKSACFTADPASAAPAYSIVIPPPNVTGVLTLGHVLNNTLQDILARRARQTGHEVLWLPGTDHAGIATQTVVERQLRKEEKKTRHDLGREEFLKKVWEWKEKHGGIIIRQLQKLGCSCDWTRERFTMDSAYARKVQEVFIDLYKRGLIYRGKRMVNWCPVSLTALSDEEVIPKKQKGYLYHFKVDVIEHPGTWLEIATTRPETIMGDTAIAVNPRDIRYAHLIGNHVRRPLPSDQSVELPIIGDEAVDFEFGTGVLKVTPAHDKADYEIGLRHHLPVVDIMNPDGTLNDLAGEGFAGLDRFEARVEAVERLRDLGFLTREEPYENNVGFSERTDVPVEPRLSEQWFLKYPRTNEARDAVRNGLIRFFPSRWEKVYDHWLENIQDWCISRQLWWGHRIPVWYPPHNNVGITSEPRVQIESPGDGWIQDPDVLDTWFSSWLWAHDTMDEPTRAKFYPTSVLVTGPDIIFFWVARMIMAGLEYTGEVPFRDVYFTGIIRDKSGRKMSKSLGNSPDPLDLIAKYGADGLRFGIIRVAPQGQDIKFDEKQIEEGRNFANKLWNAARFREMQGPCTPKPTVSGLNLPDVAIHLLDRFDKMHSALRAAYAEYRFHEVAAQLYDFFWGDYCDWFVEASKPILIGSDKSARDAILATMDVVLAGFLRLLHPLMPHITEELWKRLGYSAPASASGTRERSGFLLYTQPPEENHLAGIPATKIDEARTNTTALYGEIHTARNLRAEFKIPSQQKVRFIVIPKNEAAFNLSRPIFATLTQSSEVIIQKGPPPSGIPSAIAPSLTAIYLPLEGLVDLEAEKKRIALEITKVEAELSKVNAKLADPSFVEKVPAAVLEDHRNRHARWNEKLVTLRSTLSTLG